MCAEHAEVYILSLQMQQALQSNVPAAAKSAATARKVDRELAKLLQSCARQQHKAQVCKVSLDLHLSCFQHSHNWAHT